MCSCAIIIPVYKSIPDRREVVSLIQLDSVLHDRSLFFVSPDSLEMDNYLALIDNAKVERFDDRFFESIEAYNELCLTESFYRRFEEKGYDYILIHQTDVFLFSDKLDEFVEMGYDYIGAPWLTGHVVLGSIGYKVLKVGNGGLSLRRIKGCIEAIRRKDECYTIRPIPEDMYFSYSDSDYFRVAPFKVALRFSIEKRVRECFELNYKQLPFGCHAWWKYDYVFWEDYIRKQGYNLELDASEFSQEDYFTDEEEWLDIRLSNLFNKQNQLELFIRNVMEFKGINLLYVWGAGYFGEFYSQLFKDYKVDIEAYVDSSADLIGRMINGYTIIPPTLIKGGSSVIVSSKKNYTDICRQMRELGINRIIMIEDLLP